VAEGVWLAFPRAPPPLFPAPSVVAQLWAGSTEFSTVFQPGWSLLKANLGRSTTAKSLQVENHLNHVTCLIWFHGTCLLWFIYGHPPAAIQVYLWLWVNVWAAWMCKDTTVRALGVRLIIGCAEFVFGSLHTFVYTTSLEMRHLPKVSHSQEWPGGVHRNMGAPTLYVNFRFSPT
jgi:hypothetical protein